MRHHPTSPNPHYDRGRPCCRFCFNAVEARRCRRVGLWAQQIQCFAHRTGEPAMRVAFSSGTSTQPTSRQVKQAYVGIIGGAVRNG